MALRASRALLLLASSASARRTPPDSGALSPTEVAVGELPWKQIRLDVADGVQSLAAAADGQDGLVLRAADGDGQGSLAWAGFSDSLDSVGWSKLVVRTSEAADANDRLKMYAAGVVEGYLTARRMVEFFHNSRALLEMNPENEPRLPQFKEAMQRAVNTLDASGEGDSPFSTQVQLAFLQTKGVRDGYMAAKGNLKSADPPSLSMVDMFILNSDGVIDELIAKYGGAGDGDTALLQRRELRGVVRPHGRAVPHRSSRRKLTGHCTGLVRLAEDKSELYFGHTTWESFSEMTRIWKVYDFPLNGASTRKISFSSYPGCVSSTDDYYLMDSGLAVTETTLNLPGRQRYAQTTGVPDFLRIMASNRVANTGEAWVQSMVDSATGTYSSQWMVVDYKKFAPGQDLPPGTFYVLEQVPGVSHYEDMSPHLQSEGYWASYDRAYFDEVRQTSGDAVTEAKLEQRGDAEAALYTKGNTPRAQIIRHTIQDADSLAGMRSEMTRNLGKEQMVEQSSLRQPRFDVSARDDLDGEGNNDPNGSPNGGVDAKVTSSCLFRSLTAEAISSPSHQSMPAFKWQGSDGQDLWPGYPHEGLPNTAAFDWVSVDPNSPSLSPLQDSGCN